MNPTQVEPTGQPGAGHVIEPAAAPLAGIERDRRGETFYHHAAGRSGVVRSYTVCDSFGPLEEHRGRSLEPERVLSLLARGFIWDAPASERARFADPDPARQDVCVFEGATLVGLVLNLNRKAEWYDGAPLALLVTSTSSGTTLERIEPAERPDLEGDD